MHDPALRGGVCCIRDLFFSLKGRNMNRIIIECIYWYARFKVWRMRSVFILKRMAIGDTYGLACWRWTLVCMDRKTREVFGDKNGMGNCRVPLRDGDIHHDSREV